MRRLIEKKTGTYAEALEAIGTASLLAEIHGAGAQIRDHQTEFSIEVAGDVPSEAWKPPSLGFRYIWDKTKEHAKPEVPNLLDYDDARQKRKSWIEFEQAQKKLRRVQDQAADQDLATPEEPPPEIEPALILASMRKGWNSDRDLAKWAHSHPGDFLAWIRHSLGTADKPPNTLPKFSNSQVLNPISGKGVNAPKTQLRSPGSIPNQLLDPFAEWMKFRGLWSGMLLYRSGDDFKFFVLEPADISLDGLEAIRRSLQHLRLWGGVRLDIWAALGCARVLINNSDAVQDSRAAKIRLLRRSPREVLAGMRQAFFLSLGTAPALMNDAFLPLPSWFRVDTRDDADEYVKIIGEAIGSQEGAQRSPGCLYSLDEKKSDDGRILQQFRQWILTEDPWELLEFHHQFAVHLIQKLAAHKWAKPFSTTNLDILLPATFEEEHNVRDIIQDEGFQSVARAVRNTTIYAAQLPDSRREVQFGLAQKWKQKIKAGNEEFTAAVAEFVQAQNWEVVHKLAGRGHVVTTPQLDSLIELIQNRGAELVGSLLLAYGYARAPKIEEEVAPAKD